MARNSVTDNFLALNQGMNPLVNFNFLLRVELVYDLPCKSVKAFTREMEYEYIQEGGLNDYVHMRRKPISKPFTLEVERYAGVDYVDPLPLGAELLLPVFLFVSRYQNKFISVARTYVFTGCTVTKKVYGELTADRSGLLTDTITIAYREMICLDTPFSDVIAAPIVGTGEPTDKAYTAWKAETDKKLLAKLPQDIEELRRKEAAQAETNRKNMERIAQERAEKEKELKALEAQIWEAIANYEQRRKEIEEERKQMTEDIKELYKEQAAMVTEYNRQMAADIAARNALAAEVARLRAAEIAAAATGDAERRAALEAERLAKQQEQQELQDKMAQDAELHNQAMQKIDDERQELVTKLQEMPSALDEIKNMNDAKKAKQGELDDLDAEEAEDKAKLKRLEDERKAKEKELKEKS